MSENAGSIFYTVDIEVDKTLRAQQQIDQGFDKLQKGMDDTDRSASKLGGGLSKLAVSIAAVVSAGAIREMAGLVQKYQEMAERVQMATSSQAEFEMVQKRLLNTANQTYRRLDEAQELYIRTADSLRSMGYSTEQALDVTDSMSFAFVKNATSADRANAAISALSKSVNTGKVAADQWETITSAIPTVIDDIADASKRTSAEVRALGAAGKLTAQDLTEGLRKSLDENSKAAAGMAANLTDAGVRVRTALTQVLVSLEAQTGGLQAVTDGIITAANAMLEFGADAEGMAAALEVGTTAAGALAAVMAGRVLAALAAFVQQNVVAAIAATRTAQANLALAAAEEAAAMGALSQARASAAATVGLSTHAAAATTLAAAEARATVASTALAAAQTAMVRTATVATVAARGLAAVMGLLGGPVGVAIVAAYGIYQLGTRLSEYINTGGRGKAVTQELTASLGQMSTAAERATKRYAELTTGIEKLNKVELGARKLELETQLANAERQLKSFTRQFEKGVGSTAMIEGAQAAVDELRGSLEKLGKPTGPTAGAPTDTSEEGQKSLDRLRQQLELSKLQGEARAKLAAIQQLGAKATQDEKDEAAKLAAEIYRLDEAQKKAGGSTVKLTEAQKAAKKSAEEMASAQEQDAKVIGNMAEALYQASLGATELAQRQAELTLSDYATPEQIASVKQLAAELQRVQDLEQREKKFGDGPSDVKSAIVGDVAPLQGGQFDEQTARYEAEALAEGKRYADAQERLQEALELELITRTEYANLEVELRQQTSDRMAQIEQARNDMMIQAAGSAFGQMSQDLMAFAQTFGQENAAMFNVAKGAAIAQALINTYTAATGAMASLSAIPIVGPALGIAAAAAAVAGGMAQVSAIRSQSPGRALGGPVQAHEMYRVNEGGKPEIFNAANGQQYMMPNQRGEVVSNRDAAAPSREDSPRPNVTINQSINVHGRPDNRTANQIAAQSAQKQRASQSRFGK